MWAGLTAHGEEGARKTMKKRAFLACVVAVATSAILPASGMDTYDYEVEYLESSGGQYIDTGIVPDYNTTFKATYEFRSLISSGNDMLAGVRTTSGQGTRYYPIALEGTLLKERYVLSTTTRRKEHLALARHEIVFNDENHKVFVDAAEVGSFGADLTSSTRTCWLFGGNSEGSSHWFAAGRIYECQILTNNVLARSFKPVVDGNGEACMFDEVEQKLYRNGGTGSFTAGPRPGSGEEETGEKPWYLVEYLESTGTQHVDTGLPAHTNTQTDVGYQYVGSQWANGDMISGVQSPSRYYTVSLRSASARQEGHIYGADEAKRTYPEFYRHELCFNDAKRRVVLDGEVLGSFSAEFTSSTRSVFIFAGQSSGGNASWKSKARIWHYDISEDGTPLRKFIPAVDTNGVACFHDLVSSSNYYNKGTGDFKVGRIISAEVPLDLSTRTDLAAGLNVLPFEVRPSYGTVFKLDETTAATYATEVRSDGVYLVDKNSAGDAARVIEVTGETAIQFKEGEMPVCSSIVLSGMVTLTADCDWRGLGTIVVPDGVIVDLNGHDLLLKGFTAEPGAQGTFASSVSGGRLRVEVAENDVFVNDRVGLSGNLRLVKEGAGTFVAAKDGQSYSGGTEVAGGIMRLAAIGATYAGSLGLETSVVKVNSGCVLDVNGVRTCAFNYELAGGTLTTGCDSPIDRRLISSMTLTDDSAVSNRVLGMIGASYKEVKVRLNGHTLRSHSSGQTYFICNTTFEDEGTVQVLGGWFRTLEHEGDECVGRNITLEFPRRSGGLYLDAPFTVSNFFNKAYQFNGTNTLRVLGTYRPSRVGSANADGLRAFPNMVLADGATFDLSEMGPIATFETTSANGNNVLTFEDNATVKVKLGGRSIPADTPVIGWTAETKPDNLDTLKFVCGDEGQNYALDKRADGLYVVKGLTIFIR